MAHVMTPPEREAPTQRAPLQLDAAEPDAPPTSTERPSPITERARYALRCLNDGQHSPAAVARFNQGIAAYLDALAAIYGARWAGHGQLTIDVDDRDADAAEIEAYVGHDSACTRMLGVILRAGDGGMYSTCQRGLYDPNPQQDADRAGLGRMARLHRLLSSMYARAERVQQREPRQLKADHHALAAEASRHLADAWAA